MILPILDPLAKAHSESLTQTIRERIFQGGGMISFAEFMELALYAPGQGYYCAGQHKLGKGGDFTTAPEISLLFAHCAARQFKQIMNILPQASILEIGAGSGKLAQDILIQLEKENALPEYYFILEISADLRERQINSLKKNCPHLFSRIRWLDSLENFKLEGMVIANEVLDALPVCCFEIQNQIIYERCVKWENNQFQWHLTQPSISQRLIQYITLLKQNNLLAENYISEINLFLPDWIKTISETLQRGVIILSDYGYGQAEYYHPDRSMGTLMCYYQHHRHDNPFEYIGLQDITAHVDFTRVIESAAEAGCRLAGYTTQAGFLLGCGLLDIFSLNTDPIAQYQHAQVIKKLTLPSEMGEAVKVIGLSKNFDEKLIGFSLIEFDRRRDL